MSDAKKVVWIVLESDSWQPSPGWPIAVYSNEDAAKKFLAEKKKSRGVYNYEIEEVEVRDV